MPLKKFKVLFYPLGSYIALIQVHLDAADFESAMQSASNLVRAQYPDADLEQYANMTVDEIFYKSTTS